MPELEAELAGPVRVDTDPADGRGVERCVEHRVFLGEGFGDLSAGSGPARRKRVKLGPIDEPALLGFKLTAPNQAADDDEGKSEFIRGFARSP